MRLHPAIKNSERSILPFRNATLSTRIVAEVRDALFAKELRPGDFLGTEKDLAQRFAVSRIVARDALRTLEAHRQLASLIEMRDGAGARRLMDEHVRMIGARRIAEHRSRDGSQHGCC